ncbi:MAG: AraC family transcriptional regulator, partial [Planctomycetota bacterium]
AKVLLSRRVVLEAKRLLAQSQESVNAVAERLGFGETTNFVRYFRGESGLTPQAFREEQRTA